MTISAIEKTECFQELHPDSVVEAVEKIVHQFGRSKFIRSHIVALIKERNLCRDRPLEALDETVRQAVVNLCRNGVIEKTGEIKFGRSVYRRRKKL